MRYLVWALLFCFSTVMAATPQQAEKTFIQTISKKDHFNQQQLMQLFSRLHKDPAVIHAMTTPSEKKSWIFYRNFFITQDRVTLGADYLKKHNAMLLSMQKKYGIPASIITAIIGVETKYGTVLGKYRVLPTLYTLAFYYPPREKFFTKELEEYLILARANHLAIATLKGSYAGALGIPQFMPSSYRYYARPAHTEKYIDLFRNHNDAIVSIANYFHRMHWASNQPIARKLRSSHSPLHHGEERIAFTFPDYRQYWALEHNFQVIMSYNHNLVYAMVVYQLSQAIEHQYAKNNKAKIHSKAA